MNDISLFLFVFFMENTRELTGRPRQPIGEIGILLDRLLTTKSWSIRDLVREAGVSNYQNVQAFIRGTRKPSTELLSKLLAPFNLEAHPFIQIREKGTNRIVQTLGDSTNGSDIDNSGNNEK